MSHDPDGENPNDIVTEEVVDLDNEEELLKYIQKERLKLYGGVKKAALGGDVKATRAADAVLKSLENQPLALRKLDVENKSADNMGAMAAAISEVLDRNGTAATRHDGGDGEGAAGPDFDVSDMPIVTLKQGIATTESSEVDLEEIITKGVNSGSFDNQDED